MRRAGQARRSYPPKALPVEASEPLRVLVAWARRTGSVSPVVAVAAVALASAATVVLVVVVGVGSLVLVGATGEWLTTNLDVLQVRPRLAVAVAAVLLGALLASVVLATLLLCRPRRGVRSERRP